ncbi:MAG: nucleoside diphosphate kinase regulator [Geminicoccaceae bacterium]|jgi:regulator of nucleoside diphosphate kinase|nr:nucleoside diphosphate kinase regulator [Geminicoccaceae bacterium]MCB9967345.1 nucleoside diphosphate kinase regulator [Geminicoccaceae bacterium]HRY23194.1 nucleoside diphosphate kinase regulator [Geminicoccaceae bacterium]
MDAEAKKHAKPVITLTQSDHDSLTGMARTTRGEVAEQLFEELERARVVPDHKLRPGIVRMGSTLRFSTDSGESREVTLVYPGEADIAAGKVSVLTPIGAALIGLAAGQSIDWVTRDGRRRRLTVENVVDARPAPAEAPAAAVQPTP